MRPELMPGPEGKGKNELIRSGQVRSEAINKRTNFTAMLVDPDGQGDLIAL